MDVTDRIIEKINYLLPLYLMGSVPVDKLIVIIGTLFIPIIIDKIKKYFSIYKPINQISVTLKQEKFYTNYSYRNVVSFLAHHIDDIPEISTDSVMLYNNMNKVLPIYKTNIGDFEYEYKGYFLSFNHTEHNNKEAEYYLVIKGPAKKIIHAFINHCNEWYISQRDKQEKNTYCIYKNIKEEWKHSSINVVKTFENTFISPDNEAIIQNSLKSFLQNKEYYSKHGIPYKIGYLFHGVAGCGKSSVIFAICNQTERNIYSLNCSELTSKSHLIDLIYKIPPGNILVIEEIDTFDFSQSRSMGEEDDKKVLYFLKNNLLSSILEVLDGYSFLNDTIIIFTSNHPENLDPALVRPGRIDHKIEFGYITTTDELFKVLKFYFPEYEFTDITLPKNLTTSHLINTIILPHTKNPQRVVEIINGGVISLCKIG